MRPKDSVARDRLEAVLRRIGPASAPELSKALSISTATVRRMLDEQRQHIKAAGQARRSRYAWRRALRGQSQALPVFSIDAQGRPHEAGLLTLTQPQNHCHWQAPQGWGPTPPEARDGWWEGLPYPLQDMRPQGYMGRIFALAHHEQYQLADDPHQWSDDDVLVAISQAGSDLSGNLILGEAALRQWQAQAMGHAAPVCPKTLGTHYVSLAEQAMTKGAAGSSAAGEFPKFTAARALDGSLTPHVIVKFSGSERSHAVRRWSDLLVCEHLALIALGALDGQQVSRSRIIQHGDRTFLESERFDRHGLLGRSALVSLGVLDGAFVGVGTNDWPTIARRLEALKLLAAEQLDQLDTLWWFGRLIGNTDMHTGNLSLQTQGDSFSLAPAYDMLPMLYAPARGGEAPTPEFAPKWPLPGQQAPWLSACQAALAFWQAASTDSRISDEFRGVARSNHQVLERLRDRL